MPPRAVKTKGIASWPEEERPREHLLFCGPQAVTDAELVAILRPKDYNNYFNELRKRNFVGFVSELDVVMCKTDGDKG